MKTATALETKNNNQDQTGKFRITQERAADGISTIAERIHDKSDTARDFVDEKLSDVERFVGEKAKNIDEYSRQKLEAANSLGHRTAELLENSSEKLRNSELSESAEKLVSNIRERPHYLIGAAGMFGLLLGYSLGRRRTR